MNRSLIIEMLKELQKITCKKCVIKEIEMCYGCDVHILINNILQELNGGDSK